MFADSGLRPASHNVPFWPLPERPPLMRAAFRSSAQRVLRPSVPDRLVPRTVRPEACEAHALADSVERTSVTPPLRHRPQGRGAFLFLARSRPAREAALEKVGRGQGMPPYPLFSRAKGNGSGGSCRTRSPCRALEARVGTRPAAAGRSSASPPGPLAYQLRPFSH